MLKIEPLLAVNENSERGIGSSKTVENSVFLDIQLVNIIDKRMHRKNLDLCCKYGISMSYLLFFNSPEIIPDLALFAC
jgi:hypothetical protein